MSIILRTLKGSALTYEEMDRNFSQYFYSSSVHDSGTELRLHYTGSDSLDTATEDYGPDRYHSVTLGSGGSGGVTKITAGTGVTISPVSGTGNVTINASGAAGNNPGGDVGSIQYKVNGTTFGGNTDLFYSTSTLRTGLGTSDPQTKLHIVGSRSNPAIIRIATDGGTDSSSKAQVSFYSGTTKLGEIGKTVAGSSTESGEIYLQATNNLRFQNKANTIASVTSNGLGVFDLDPNRQLSVVGAGGIGIQKGANRDTQSIIRPIVDGIYASNVLQSGANSYGLMLSAPLTSENNAGGHIVVSLSEYSSRGPSVPYNSFTIVESTNENYSIATAVATFKSNKKVGIATNSPQTTLDVNGQIRGKYTTNAVDEPDLDIDTSKVVKAVITNSITFTSDVSPAGTEATVIIQGSTKSIKTVSFGGTFKLTNPTLTVNDSDIYTMTFVSDGVYWYETGRSGRLV